MSLPTVTDLKLESNVSNSADDNELQGKLDAAVALVEGLVGPLSGATVTETHRNVWAGSLLLRRHPATAVTAVSVRSAGSTAAAQDVADYELDPDGTLHLASGYWHRGDVTVTYTVGRGVIPADIFEATVQIGAHMWETQRGTAPSSLQLQDPDAFDAGPSGRGYSIPNRAMDLLRPHLRQTSAL